MTELEETIIGQLYMKCETQAVLINEQSQTICKQDETIATQKNIIVQLEHTINQSNESMKPYPIKDFGGIDAP